MKSILLFTFAIVASYFGSAQKIKLKQDKILLNEIEMLDYEKRQGNRELLVYPIGLDQEIIFFVRNNNETPQFSEDDFVKIHFVEQDLILETNAHRGSWKSIIKWLVQNELFDENGALIPEQVEKFVARYDENITQRTVR